MTISKTNSFIPEDLSKLFQSIRDKTVSTAQNFAQLVKYYALAIYTSLENIVERLRPSRVTVITPQKLVVIPRTQIKPMVSDAASQTSPSAPEKIEEPVETLKNAEPVLEKKIQFPTLQDLNTAMRNLPQIKIPDLESSLLKVIELSRDVFKAPIENNEQLNRQLLDPFNTHSEI